MKASTIRKFFLQEYCGLPIGGHAGLFNKFNQNIFWQGMQQDVATYVSSRKTCQQKKYLPAAPFGLVQPIPPPTAIWEDIAIDIIVDQPNF